MAEDRHTTIQVSNIKIIGRDTLVYTEDHLGQYNPYCSKSILYNATLAFAVLHNSQVAL